MDASEAFGRRLRELRKRRGLTQQQLSEGSEVDAKYIGLLENGRGNPTLRVIEGLAEGLTVEPADLLTYRHQAEPDELLRDLKALCKKAEPEDLARAVKLLRALLV